MKIYPLIGGAMIFLKLLVVVAFVVFGSIGLDLLGRQFLGVQIQGPSSTARIVFHALEMLIGAGIFVLTHLLFFGE